MGPHQGMSAFIKATVEECVTGDWFLNINLLRLLKLGWKV